MVEAGVPEFNDFLRAEFGTGASPCRLMTYPQEHHCPIRQQIQADSICFGKTFCTTLLVKYILQRAALALLLTSLDFQLSTARAQNGTFTYQGMVASGGARLNCTGQFQFALVTSSNLLLDTYWSNDGTSVNGSEPTAGVSVGVTNGLFTVVLGDTTISNMAVIPISIFNHSNLALQIWFNDGTHGFAALNPPQLLTPTPYAINAASAANANFATSAGSAGAVAAANITGTLPVSGLPASVVTNGATGVNITGAFSGNGAGLTNLNAANFTGFSFVSPPAGGGPILNMVWIVPGTFIMGAPASDPDYVSDETQHVVTLTNGFWIGQHPVTQGEYLAVVGANPSYYTADLSSPVERVTWFNANNYCNLLTLQEQGAGRLPAGWVYRLPTEAEWEYCCRAQTTSRYYFGNDPGDGTSLTNYAWYAANSGGSPQPVGQLLPNAWGLVDMVGNVFEWCQDWYGAYPTANVSFNPQGPDSGTVRVFRGDCWQTPAAYARSASRASYNPSDVSGALGFRVVLAPGQ